MRQQPALKIRQHVHGHCPENRDTPFGPGSDFGEVLPKLTIPKGAAPGPVSPQRCAPQGAKICGVSRLVRGRR